MKKKDLLNKIARLESVNDQLASEIAYLDYLTRKIGFERGLTSLKSAAQELIKEQNNNKDQ